MMATLWGWSAVAEKRGALRRSGPGDGGGGGDEGGEGGGDVEGGGELDRLPEGGGTHEEAG